ncbi:MAG TPA: protein-methionine-sulfoxide reductase catalytic subunit MsrP [Burkholderiaceae bacterium]|nr:protein-methionine-sulfoxide reductase catalytic subunit MsrP [Burkholderiaceae bacterium]
MSIQRFPQPPSSEITPRPIYEQRRRVLQAAAAGLAVATPAWLAAQPRADTGSGAQKLETRPSPLSTIEKPTPYKDVVGYNNFYEFGTDKDDPARFAKSLKTRPWTVAVEGEVARPRVFDIDELPQLAPLEERIYRMRCVEGWSMVIPWVGYSLSELIRRVEPTGNAKYIAFETLADRAQMPGLRSSVLQWPYVEGLRLDEANHPLTLLTLGLYGEVLPNQNGAPVRIVVPWKYGFKSGKSIVRIRFVEQQPVTSWSRSAPHEYGFYSNVNPEVPHPRWSQATERRIGEDGFLQRKRKTLMFNGYADQVASLYAGMDLKRFY